MTIGLGVEQTATRERFDDTVDLRAREEIGSHAARTKPVAWGLVEGVQQIALLVGGEFDHDRARGIRTRFFSCSWNQYGSAMRE